LPRHTCAKSDIDPGSAFSELTRMETAVSKYDSTLAHGVAFSPE
jgi:hypothetical protein